MKTNEHGYVLLGVLLFSLILSVIGIAAIHTSNIEIQIAGQERFYNENFYDIDGKLIEAIEQRYVKWIDDDDFLLRDPTEAYISKAVDEDDDGETDFFVEVRCIEPDRTKITGSDEEQGLSAWANDIPGDAHIGAAPHDYYISAGKFAVRRFAVTVRSADNRTILQAGVWKAIPKEQE